MQARQDFSIVGEGPDTLICFECLKPIAVSRHMLHPLAGKRGLKLSNASFERFDVATRLTTGFCALPLPSTIPALIRTVARPWPAARGREHQIMRTGQPPFTKYPAFFSSATLIRSATASLAAASPTESGTDSGTAAAVVTTARLVIAAGDAQGTSFRAFADARCVLQVAASPCIAQRRSARFR